VPSESLACLRFGTRFRLGTRNRAMGTRYSYGLSGRFVLLPKNVVTGAAKMDIMRRSTHTGRCFLWKAILQAPARSGLFVPGAN
jgi:hypothetical protein